MVVMSRRADRMTSSARRSARSRSLAPLRTVTQRRRSVVSSVGGRGSRNGVQPSGVGSDCHNTIGDLFECGRGGQVGDPAAPVVRPVFPDLGDPRRHRRQPRLHPACPPGPSGQLFDVVDVEQTPSAVVTRVGDEKTHGSRRRTAWAT